MSASSSTTSMSCAMENLLSSDGLRGRAFRLLARPDRREDQLHPRAAALPIFQDQLSPVLLHDLLDDREPEARALCAGRDVGLGQALAAFLGQAAAVVLDHQRDLAGGLDEPNPDASRRRLAVAPLYGFDGVLEQIDQCLAHLA